MAAYPLLPVFAPTKEIAAIELVKGLVSVTNEATKLREAFEAKKITLEAYASAGRASQQDLRLVTHHIISLGEAALPELFKLTTTKDDADIRYNALNALRGMNFPRKSAPAERVLAEVRRLLDDTNPSVKALAEVTLKKLMAE